MDQRFEEKQAENDYAQKEDTQKSLGGWRKWVMLAVVCATFSLVGVIFSVPPAFYPSEAEDRGVSPSQYGFVFGISNLSAAIFALVFAVYGSRIGAKFLYVSGTVGLALSGGLLFGTLAYIDDGTTFLILSYILRFVFGMADSGAFGSSLSILFGLWPANFATIFAAMETCFGFGYAVGPYLGSVTYEAGGFELPFYIFGSIDLVLAIAGVFVVPNVKSIKSGEIDDENADDDHDKTGKGSLTLPAVFKTPSICVPIMSNLMWMWGFGFVEGMLEPFAKDVAGLSQDQVGLSFLIFGSVYMVCTPIFGQLCDNLPGVSPTLYSVAASIVAFAAFTLIGPAPFVSGLDPSVELIFTCMAMLGVASAAIQVSTFSRAHKAVESQGFLDNMDTYLNLTGSWTFSFYAGCFLGPTVGGFLVEAWDFQRAIYLYLVIYGLLVVLDTVMLAKDCWGVRKEGQK